MATRNRKAGPKRRRRAKRSARAVRNTEQQEQAKKARPKKKGGKARPEGKKGKKGKKGKGKVKSLKGVKKEITKAQDIASQLGFLDPLEKLDTSIFEQYADPNSAMFAGKRSDEEGAYLDKLNARMETAGQRSEQMKKILGIMEGGLAGLDSKENEALRGRATREIQRQNDALVNQLDAQRSNVRGRAFRGAQNQLARQQMESQSALEQDLIAQNIDVQDRRRGQYFDALSGTEQSEFDRTSEANRDYGSSLYNIDQKNYQQGRDARQDLASMQQFNIGQSNADREKDMAAAMGILGYGLSKKTAKQNYNLAKAQASGGGGGGGGGGAPDYSAYINAVEKIGKQQFGEDATV